jgi:hypothetical protein
VINIFFVIFACSRAVFLAVGTRHLLVLFFPLASVETFCSWVGVDQASEREIGVGSLRPQSMSNEMIWVVMDFGSQDSVCINLDDKRGGR